MTFSKASPTATGSITCPDFDPALGTLTGAIYIVPGGITYLSGSSFTVSNPTATAITFPDALVVANLAFAIGAFPDGQTSSGSSPLVNANSPPAFFGPGGSVLFTPSSEPYLNVPGFVPMNSTALSAIIGNSTFVLPVSVEVTDIVAKEGELPLELTDYTASFYINATALPGQTSGYFGSVVFYTYTPNLQAAPESSAIFLAAGGLGLVFTTRFRKIRL